MKSLVKLMFILSTFIFALCGVLVFLVPQSGCLVNIDLQISFDETYVYVDVYNNFGIGDKDLEVSISLYSDYENGNDLNTMIKQASKHSKDLDVGDCLRLKQKREIVQLYYKAVIDYKLDNGPWRKIESKTFIA